VLLGCPLDAGCVLDVGCMLALACVLAGAIRASRVALFGITVHAALAIGPTGCTGGLPLSAAMA
jgi:hypothetical protein